MTTADSVQSCMSDEREESARAMLYGLLAALFYAPPPQPVMDSIAASADEDDSILQHAWREVATAAHAADAEQVRAEYEALFIGVGKPEVALYGSSWLSGFMMEKPLAELRTDLARLGLERDAAMQESEDHIGALCDAMRCLIASGGAGAASLDVQRRFFATHMQPWVAAMCDAIDSHPGARFYRAVARFAKTFFEVEALAFDMTW